MSPAQLDVRAVAAPPKTPTEIAAARAVIIGPLSKAFVDSTFTVEQQSATLNFRENIDLFYRYHERSRVSATLPKRRSPSPLILNL